MVTNTCVEATARYAYELGYNITMLYGIPIYLRDRLLTKCSPDATGGFNTAQKDAATTLIWPLFSNKVVTVDEWAKSLQST